MKKIVVQIAFACLVFLVYGALYFALMWSLTYHPVALLSVIAIGGIPIVLLVHKYWKGEAERRGVWSNLRDLTRGKLESVPGRDKNDEIVASAQFGEVFFRILNLNANDAGIRIDRPFSAVRPIVIPWESIQRLDTMDCPHQPQFRNKNIKPACHIFLTNSDKPLAIVPWPESFAKFVPENIGSREYRPYKNF